VLKHVLKHHCCSHSVRLCAGLQPILSYRIPVSFSHSRSLPLSAILALARLGSCFLSHPLSFSQARSSSPSLSHSRLLALHFKIGVRWSVQTVHLYLELQMMDDAEFFCYAMICLVHPAALSILNRIPEKWKPCRVGSAKESTDVYFQYRFLMS
jgi:hypothetical protein